MAFREWQQADNGAMTLDCSKEIHDVRMNCDALYRADHIDKVEKYKDVPWVLRTRNKPLVAAALIAIAFSTGLATLAALSEPTEPNATEIKK